MKDPESAMWWGGLSLGLLAGVILGMYAALALTGR